MTTERWIDAHGCLLGPDFPMALDLPFTRAMARDSGITVDSLRSLARQGLVRRVFHGVYAPSQAPDSISFRSRALALVVPEYAVVTDRTAAWLHGVPILKRGSHLVAPPLEICDTRDTRVRREGVEGRRRQLRERDIELVGGVRSTTLLRTGCDLGRLLWRFDALAGLDGVCRLGVNKGELAEEALRFRGFRGVRQLRALAPLSDPRSESPGESALRLHWLDAGLPVPALQYAITDDSGVTRFRLDVPAPEVRYAAEYDGAQFHSSYADKEHDLDRRAWIREHRHWVIDVFGKEDVYSPRTDIRQRLLAGFAQARRSFGIWSP